MDEDRELTRGGRDKVLSTHHHCPQVACKHWLQTVTLMNEAIPGIKLKGKQAGMAPFSQA